MITHEKALEALDSFDGYTRMDCGVDAVGPRTTLEEYIKQQSDGDKDGDRYRWLVAKLLSGADPKSVKATYEEPKTVEEFNVNFDEMMAANP